jgi:hypothetical protein
VLIDREDVLREQIVSRFGDDAALRLSVTVNPDHLRSALAA